MSFREITVTETVTVSVVRTYRIESNESNEALEELVRDGNLGKEYCVNEQDNLDTSDIRTITCVSVVDPESEQLKREQLEYEQAEKDSVSDRSESTGRF